MLLRVWSGSLRVVELSFWLATGYNFAGVINEQQVRGRHERELLSVWSHCRILKISVAFLATSKSAARPRSSPFAQGREDRKSVV